MDPAEGRRCPECEKIVVYGIWCSNKCADKAYKRWKEINQPTTKTRRVK